MEDYIEKFRIDQNKALSIIISTLETASSTYPPLIFMISALKSVFGENSIDMIKDDIARLWIAIEGIKSGNFGSAMIELALPELEKKSQFRRAKETLFLAQLLNSGSLYGYNWDPMLSYDEGVKNLRDNGSVNPEKSMRMAIHELKTNKLIYVRENGNAKSGIEGIGPNRYFFAQTDSLFQNWDLKEDAKSVIKEALVKDNFSVSHKTVMEKYGWSKRRMNSILMYLEFNGLIHKIEHGIMDELWGYYVRATPEAEFFVDD